jgi:hypothetical protein
MVQIATHGSWTSSEIVEQVLPCLRDEHARVMLHLLRRLTAYEMLKNADTYETFLPGLEGIRGLPAAEGGTLNAAVHHLVLPEGADAEHPMIQALSSLLRAPLAVVSASVDSNVRVCSACCSAAAYLSHLPFCCFVFLNFPMHLCRLASLFGGNSRARDRPHFVAIVLADT